MHRNTRRGIRESAPSDISSSVLKRPLRDRMVMIAGINLAVWAFLQSRHLGGLGECCGDQHHGRPQEKRPRRGSYAAHAVIHFAVSPCHGVRRYEGWSPYYRCMGSENSSHRQGDIIKTQSGEESVWIDWNCG